MRCGSKSLDHKGNLRAYVSKEGDDITLCDKHAKTRKEVLRYNGKPVTREEFHGIKADLKQHGFG